MFSDARAGILGDVLSGDWQRREASLARVAVAAVVAWLAVTGLVGLDIGGGNWDEPTNVWTFMWAVENHVPLPRTYGYPMAIFDVIAATASPFLLGLTSRPEYHRFFLEIRAVLIVVTAFTPVATAALARALGSRPLVAALAAALAGTSFEFATHARYIAPDALGTLLLTTSLAFAARPEGRTRDLVVAAIFGGMAASTKYTLGLVALSVALAALLMAPRFKRLLIAGGACLAAFVVVTPGAVVEPQLVVAALRYQSRIYGGGAAGYGVDGFFDMVFHLVRWFACCAASPFVVGSLVVLACALAGLALAVPAVRAAPARAAPLVLAAALLGLFLVQPTFIVRNFLPLVPLLACAAAAAAGRFRVLAAPLVIVVVVDAGYLAFAAQTVAANKSSAPVEEIASYLDRRPDETFLVSPAVREALRGLDGKARPNVVAAPTAETRSVIALTTELQHPWKWHGGDPFLFQRVFGSREVNLSLYPTWKQPHVVMMDVDKARRLGCALDFHPPPEAPPPDRGVFDATMMHPDAAKP